MACSISRSHCPTCLQYVVAGEEWGVTLQQQHCAHGKGHYLWMVVASIAHEGLVGEFLSGTGGDGSCDL